MCYRKVAHIKTTYIHITADLLCLLQRCWRLCSAGPSPTDSEASQEDPWPIASSAACPLAPLTPLKKKGIQLIPSHIKSNFSKLEFGLIRGVKMLLLLPYLNLWGSGWSTACCQMRWGWHRPSSASQRTTAQRPTAFEDPDFGFHSGVQVTP